MPPPPPPPPNTPKYNHPLTIQRIVDVPTEDDFGQIDREDDDNWETVYNGFCHPLTRGSREHVRATRLDASIALVLEVPWSPFLAALKPAGSRILYEGRRLEINGVEDPDEEHRRVLLSCTEPQEG